MKKLYAQGDLLIEEVGDEEPREGTLLPSQDGAYVLATGVATGHRHAFYSEVILFRDGLIGYGLPKGVYVCHVKIESETAELKHEEHDSVVLPQGTYRVRRQREFNGIEDRIVED